MEWMHGWMCVYVCECARVHTVLLLQPVKHRCRVHVFAGSVEQLSQVHRSNIPQNDTPTCAYICIYTHIAVFSFSLRLSSTLFLRKVGGA